MTERRGELGWIVCLAGLPWSYFLIRLIDPFKTLDIWHANTWWMQSWILILAGVHAMNKKPLGLLPPAFWWMAIWSTLLSLWMLNAQSKPGIGYALELLPALCHLWMIVLALLVMTSWTTPFLDRLATAIFWSGAALICYGWVQVANLDQFFKYIDSSKQTDSLVGLIGNPTHFACQLAIWMPFALLQPGWKRLWVLPAMGLLVLAKSSTALVIAGGLLLSWGWLRSHLWTVCAGIVGGSSSLWFLLMHHTWLNPFGRLEAWSAWWPFVVKRPILGYGLGFVKQITNQLAPTHSLAGWTHLHNEYFQWWVEAGLLGLLLMLWAGWSVWSRRNHGMRTSLRWTYGASFVACSLTAILNFSWHLWQLGGWGLMGLAGWLVLTDAQQVG